MLQQEMISEKQKARFHDSYFMEPNSGCWLWERKVDKNGYGSHFLGHTETGTKKYLKAHRLSWEIHKHEIPTDRRVCHTCDTPGCVNPNHLFLGTAKDNSQDMVRKGRHSHGSKTPSSKITEKDVLAIRASDKSYKELSAIYGVSTSTLSAIWSGKIWRHIDLKTNSANNHKDRGIHRGNACGLSKLTETEVKEIRSINYNKAFIADLYGVQRALISKITLGQIWRHIL